MAAGELRPGQAVLSRSGRDRGRSFIVLKVLDERYVLVADGELRPVDRPKKKNVRHLQSLGGLDEQVAHKIIEGRLVTDQDLRETLRAKRQEERLSDEQG